MAVLSDYKCDKHGYFESRKAACPMKGCDAEVYVVFLQAPGMVSDKTKSTDKRVKQLAIDFDMSNIKSTREGENQAGYFKRNNKFTEKEHAEAEKMVAEKRRAKRGRSEPIIEQPREPQLRDSVRWGGQGVGMDMKTVLSGAYSKPIGPQLGAEPELTSFAPKNAGINSGPVINPKATLQDPENLKIKVKK
jgi:hypothetical protein